MNDFSEILKGLEANTKDILNELNEFLYKHDMRIKKYAETEEILIEIAIKDNFKFYSFLSSLSAGNTILIDSFKTEFYLSAYDENIITLFLDDSINLDKLLKLIKKFEYYEVPICEETMKRYAQYLEDTCVPVRFIDVAVEKKNTNDKECEYFKKVIKLLESKNLKAHIKNSGISDLNEVNGFDSIPMYVDIIDTGYEIIDFTNYLNQNKNSYINEIYLQSSLMFYDFYKLGDDNILSLNIITPRYINNNDINEIWHDVYIFLKGYDNFNYQIKLPEYIFNSYCRDPEHESFALDRFKTLKRKQLSDINWEVLNFEHIDPYLRDFVKLFNNYKLSTNFSCSGLAEDHNGTSCDPYLTVIIKNELSYKLFNYFKENLTLSDIELKNGTNFLYPIFDIRAKEGAYPNGKLSDAHTIEFWNEIKDNLNEFIILNN